jgi:hypothetical protein
MRFCPTSPTYDNPSAGRVITVTSRVHIKLMFVTVDLQQYLMVRAFTIYPVLTAGCPCQIVHNYRHQTKTSAAMLMKSSLRSTAPRPTLFREPKGSYATVSQVRASGIFLLLIA